MMLNRIMKIKNMRMIKIVLKKKMKKKKFQKKNCRDKS